MTVDEKTAIKTLIRFANEAPHNGNTLIEENLPEAILIARRMLRKEGRT